MSVQKNHSALGLGNALVDILMTIENNDILDELELPPGSMTLVDGEKAKRILEQTSGLPRRLASGGSAANTLHGIASLGMTTGYIGSVGKDELGEVFKKSMEDQGVRLHLNLSDINTGTAITFISPGGERTFATYLGAATQLKPRHLPAAAFQSFSHLHIEGYLIIEPDLLQKALTLAKNAGMTVSFDLASYNVVEENREAVRNVLENFVDIVFANEEEATAFTGLYPREALNEMAEICDVSVVKLGREGSMVCHSNETFSVAALPADVVDTTGAGDLYAAGFLYGFLKGFTLEQCLKTGTLLAGKVIEVTGPKLEPDQWKKIKKQIGIILEE